MNDGSYVNMIIKNYNSEEVYSMEELEKSKQKSADHEDEEVCCCGHHHHHDEHDDGHEEHCDCGHHHHEGHDDDEHEEHCGCEHHHHHDDDDGCCSEHDHHHEHAEHHHGPAPKSTCVVYVMKNIDCANCSAKIEKKIQELPEVDDCILTFATRSEPHTSDLRSLTVR